MQFGAEQSGEYFVCGSWATCSRLASTIGRVKTAPVEARMAFGFHGSTLASGARNGGVGAGGAHLRLETDRPRDRTRRAHLPARRGSPSWPARASGLPGARDVEGAAASALNLAPPLQREEPIPPPLAPLPQAKHLLDPRILERRDRPRPCQTRLPKWNKSVTRVKTDDAQKRSAGLFSSDGLPRTRKLLGRDRRKRPGHDLPRRRVTRHVARASRDRRATFDWQILRLLPDDEPLPPGSEARPVRDGERHAGVNGGYAIAFNARYGRRDHLFSQHLESQTREGK